MIRRLEKADAPRFRELRLEALRNHPAAYATTYAESKDRALSSFEDMLANLAMFGGFADGDLVACAGLAPMPGGNCAHRSAVIAVYVAPAHRGRGLAEGLLGAIECEARDRGLAQIELKVAADNAPARAVYRRCGFDEVAVEPRAFLVNGTYLDQIAMIKRLDG
jgi:RimJ/RimL family protein N-acetyltransferase